MVVFRRLRLKEDFGERLRVSHMFNYNTLSGLSGSREIAC
jgi:hypothetical protein